MTNHLTIAILAGGLGTRLRSVVADRPKVLAPVRGRPYLCFLLDHVMRTGAREVVLLAGHGADLLQRTMGTSYGSLRLVYSIEPSPLGTGGAVRHALEHFQTPTVLLLNGDSYCDVDLARYCRWHAWIEQPMSLVLTRMSDTRRFGRVRINSTGVVRSFAEKGQESGPGWINAGIYQLQRDMLSEMPADRTVSLERDLLPSWVERGLVRGYRSRRRFLDIGTPESYARAEEFFEAAMKT